MIVRDFARLGHNICLAIADTIGAAWAVAKCKVQNAKCKMQNDEVQNDEATAPFFNLQFAFFNLHSSAFVVLPPNNAAAFLHPLPTEALRLPEDTVRLLGELGIRQIGQLEALPREGFLSRFGPLLLKRLDQAFGRLDEPVPASPEPPTFAASWSPEHPTTRRETIEAALEHLTARVAAMLTHYGRGALQLECRLTLELRLPPSALRPLCLTVGLFQPTAAAEHLFPLVQLQLERLRIPAPVTGVCVTATLTAPLEPRRQATLFELAGDRANPWHGRALATLAERLGSSTGTPSGGASAAAARGTAGTLLALRSLGGSFPAWPRGVRRCRASCRRVRCDCCLVRCHCKPRRSRPRGRRWGFTSPANSTTSRRLGGRSESRPAGGAVRR